MEASDFPLGLRVVWAAVFLLDSKVGQSVFELFLPPRYFDVETNSLSVSVDGGGPYSVTHSKKTPTTDWPVTGLRAWQANK